MKKGKPKIVPLKPEQVIKGAQVLCGNSIETIELIGDGEYDDEGHIFLKGYDPEDWFTFEELSTIVIEYWDENFDNVRNVNSKGLFTLPLKHSQWKLVLNKFDRDVEFEEVIGVQSKSKNDVYAMIIIQKEKKYDESDILTAFAHGFNIGQRNSEPILDADSVLLIAENFLKNIHNESKN